MTFAAPWVLAGLAFAAIPIILHLLARREPPTLVFPATRYLAKAAREHQRRLQLQHLLLLLLRTLAIVAIVLAAAGPSLPAGGVGPHQPTAQVIVVDNSLSSGAVRAGVPVLDALKRAAREALAEATADDRLWLVAADGFARPGSAADLLRALDDFRPDARRLDLGQSLDLARRILESSELPGEVLVFTDLQRTALGQGQPPAATAILRPVGTAIPNAGLIALTAGPQPWGADGGAIGVMVSGKGDGSRPVSVALPGRPPRQMLVPIGGQGTVRAPVPQPGWWMLEATLDADELRADDRRIAGIRVAPPARVAWTATDQYVATAADVLSQNGRIRPGVDVSLGALGREASIVFPPADPAGVGALNRALEARGVRWRFVDLDLATTTTDSNLWLGRERVARRHRLAFAGGAPRDVLGTVGGGDPWLVRSGSVILVGSRLDPDWTGLPLSAAFVPFLDALLNRATRGELVTMDAAPGDRALVPDRVTEVVLGERRWPVEGGAAFVPSELGLHFLMAETDTIGALAVNPDPRESDLDPASDADVRAYWPGVRIAGLEETSRVAFAALSRSDLRGPLLWLVVVLLIGEVALASVRRGRR